MRRMVDPSTLGMFRSICSGTFSNGFVNFDGVTLGDGLYLITYSNCSVLVPLSESMLAASGLAHIRVCMPVIYDADGSARPGILGLWRVTEPDSIMLGLFDSTGEPVVDGLGVTILKAANL